MYLTSVNATPAGDFDWIFFHQFNLLLFDLMLGRKNERGFGVVRTCARDSAICNGIRCGGVMLRIESGGGGTVRYGTETPTYLITGRDFFTVHARTYFFACGKSTAVCVPAPCSLSFGCACARARSETHDIIDSTSFYRGECSNSSTGHYRKVTTKNKNIPPISLSYTVVHVPNYSGSFFVLSMS